MSITLAPPALCEPVHIGLPHAVENEKRNPIYPPQTRRLSTPDKWQDLPSSVIPNSLCRIRRRELRRHHQGSGKRQNALVDSVGSRWGQILARALSVVRIPEDGHARDGGDAFLSSSSDFPTTSEVMGDRARLPTSPDPKGSETATMTIGIVLVACLAASAEGVLMAAITATCRLTRSAASAGNCSNRPAAQRYSSATLRPSK
jgi:hypothetical protein